MTGSSDESDARTSMSELVNKAAEDDSDFLLDAVVVGDDLPTPNQPAAASATRSSAKHSDTGSLHNGSNSTAGYGVPRRGSGLDNESYYQGGVVSWFRYRAWPVVSEFFEPRLPVNEEDFLNQTWHSVKTLTLYVQ